MKKFLCILLSLAIASCAAVFALEETTAPNEACNAELFAEPLPTPTGLRWHYNFRKGTEAFGYLAWNDLPSEYSSYMYQIKVYRDGNEILSQNMSTSAVNGLVGWDLSSSNIFTASGKYTFTVAARPFNMNGAYTQSEAAVSAEYDFVLPTNKMASVAGVFAKEDFSEISFPTTSDASSYIMTFEYTTFESSEKTLGAIMTHNKNNNAAEIVEDTRETIASIIRNNEEVKEIYVGVRAKSSNPLEYLDSDTVYAEKPYTVPEDLFGRKLKALCEKYGIHDHSENVNDLISELDSYIAEKGITLEDMTRSFEERCNVLTYYVRIYAAYNNTNAVFPDVKDTSTDSYFDTIGMNLGITGMYSSNISFTGVSFSAMEDVVIPYMTLSEPKGEKAPSSLFYENIAGLHIGFESVNNPSALKYPVWVSLPLPSGIDTSYYGSVTVLKANKDGTFTSVACSTGTTSSESTGWQELRTIDFIIEGEGDYFIANYVSDSIYDINYDMKVTADDISELVDVIVDATKQGWFGGEIMGSPYDVNSDGYFDMRDLNELMRIVRENS